MTELQRLQLRQSNLRSELQAEMAKAAEERTEGELERLTAALSAIEPEIRAAMVLEDSESEQPPAESAQQSAEARELAEIRGRLDFGRYIEAALAGAPVLQGAELEYNQARGLRPDYVPLDLIAPGPLETRAAINGDAEAVQQPWIDRLFGEACATFMGVSMRSVEPGVAAVPLTTAGGSGAQRGRTQTTTDATYTVGITELKPTRNAVRAVYSMEDDMRLPGLADAIARDLRMAVMDAVDLAIFNGDTGANENSADITGLQTAGITEVELTQAQKVNAADWLSTLGAMVDGLHASDLEDMRFVASVGTARNWLRFANSSADSQTLKTFLRAQGLMSMTRQGIDDETANDDFGGYVGLQRGIEGAAVCAVWEGAQLITDRWSKSGEGEVALTMNYFWDFKIPRPSNFRRLKYVT